MSQGPLTDEHVIPRSIGGCLVAPFICKNCNDRFGRLIEAKIKEDPTIRIAIDHLHERIPEIYKMISEGQKFIAQSGDGDIEGVVKNGIFQVKTKMNVNRSITEPIHLSRKRIEKIIRRKTSGEIAVINAMNKFDEAEEGDKVNIHKGISIRRWSIKGLKATLGNRTINDLALVKIAYEFVALTIGTSIYDHAFDRYRNILQGKQSSVNIIRVEYQRAPQYLPFHGVGLDQVSPYVIVQIRLFGMLAFLVHFSNISINHPCIYYTQDLEKKKDYVRKRA